MTGVVGARFASREGARCGGYDAVMSGYSVLYWSENGSPADGTGGQTVEAAQAKADRDGHAGAAVFRHVPGVDQRSEVVSIRQPGGGWEQFTDHYDLHSWWWKLAEPVRVQIAPDPEAPLSAEALEASVRAGAPGVSNAWWVDSESGPSGFYLPSDVVAFVRAVCE